MSLPLWTNFAGRVDDHFARDDVDDVDDANGVVIT
jgi:hypothetical protein